MSTRPLRNESPLAQFISDNHIRFIDYVRRRGFDVDAEDIVHGFYIKLLCNPNIQDQFNSAVKMDIYCFTILRHYIIDYYRTRYIKERNLERFHTSLVTTDTDHVFECMLESLRHLLEELSEELQNTWRLWLGGPRGQRIADILSEEILKDSNKQYNIYLLTYLLQALSTFTEKLHPRYRLLWELWLQGEDAGEISKKLDIPIETVRTRLRRIEKELSGLIRTLRTSGHPNT